jgi:hypothetical protein
MQCLNWRPAWGVDRAVAETAAWYRAWIGGAPDMRAVSLAQLSAYRDSTSVEVLRQSA